MLAPVMAVTAVTAMMVMSMVVVVVTLWGLCLHRTYHHAFDNWLRGLWLLQGLLLLQRQRWFGSGWFGSGRRCEARGDVDLRPSEQRTRQIALLGPLRGHVSQDGRRDRLAREPRV